MADRNELLRQALLIQAQQIQNQKQGTIRMSPEDEELSQTPLGKDILEHRDAPPENPTTFKDKLAKLLTLKPNLGENDFTVKGEPIPKEGGILNWMRYNLAHFDPTTKENIMGAATGGSGMGAAEDLAQTGKTMYKAGLKPLDAVSESAGTTRPISDILLENNISGSNKSIGEQSANLLEKRAAEKQAILQKVNDANVRPDIDAAFSVGNEHANKLRASRDADKIEAADALAAEMERRREPLRPNKAADLGVNASPMDPHNPMGEPTIMDLESVKQSTYGGLSPNAYKNGSRAAQDMGNRGQKALARGFKQEIENTASRYEPGLGDKLGKTNEEIGGLLNTSAAMNKEAIKAGNKNLLTSVDPMVYTLGYGKGMGSSDAGSGVAALLLKKIADLSKTTAGRTTLGKNMYNFGKGMEEFHPAADQMLTQGTGAYLRKQSDDNPNYWGVLNDINGQKENK